MKEDGGWRIMKRRKELEKKTPKKKFSTKRLEDQKQNQKRKGKKRKCGGLSTCRIGWRLERRRNVLS